jgi:hypothetical protein
MRHGAARIAPFSLLVPVFGVSSAALVLGSASPRRTPQPRSWCWGAWPSTCSAAGLPAARNSRWRWISGRSSTGGDPDQGGERASLPLRRRLRRVALRLLRSAEFHADALSLLAIDMATTATNNYADFRTARRREGYNYAEHNALAPTDSAGGKPKPRYWCWSRLRHASAGPWPGGPGWQPSPSALRPFWWGSPTPPGHPISRTPLGEAFSGLAMGFVIPLLAVHVNALDRGWCS